MMYNTNHRSRESQLYEINRNLQEFNRDVTKTTRGQLHANYTSQVCYTSVGFTKEMLHLHCCSAYKIIDKTDYVYCLWNGAIISHLLYMDDIKLNARSKQDINLLIHITRMYSTDIGLSFAQEKCSQMVTKRGKVEVRGLHYYKASLQISRTATRTWELHRQ